MAFAKLFSIKRPAAHAAAWIADPSPIVVSSDEGSAPQVHDAPYDIRAHVEKLGRNVTAAEEVIAWCLKRLWSDDALTRAKLELWEGRASHLKAKRQQLQKQAPLVS